MVAGLHLIVLVTLRSANTTEMTVVGTATEEAAEVAHIVGIRALVKVEGACPLLILSSRCPQLSGVRAQRPNPTPWPRLLQLPRFPLRQPHKYNQSLVLRSIVHQNLHSHVCRIATTTLRTRDYRTGLAMDVQRS